MAKFRCIPKQTPDDSQQLTFPSGPISFCATSIQTSFKFPWTLENYAFAQALTDGKLHLTEFISKFKLLGQKEELQHGKKCRCVKTDEHHLKAHLFLNSLHIRDSDYDFFIFLQLQMDIIQLRDSAEHRELNTNLYIPDYISFTSSENATFKLHSSSKLISICNTK